MLNNAMSEMMRSWLDALSGIHEARNGDGWILYHGSSSPTMQGQLRIGERDPGWFGPGFYLTASKDYARRWGQHVHEFSVPQGLRFARVNIIGNYAKIEFDSVAQKANDMAGGTEAWIDDEHAWAQSFGKNLRALGVDGIRVRMNGADDTEVVVFDPSAIKHVGLAG